MIKRACVKGKCSLLRLSRETRRLSIMTRPRPSIPGGTNLSTKVNVIDGKGIASKIIRLLRKDIEYLQENYLPEFSKEPKLGYAIIDNRPDSELYVKMKTKVLNKIGIKTIGKHFSKSVTQDELSEYIMKLNEDKTVDGIMIQLPLPEELDSAIISNLISHQKDVDGNHPFNMAAMARHEDPLFTPCTPKGIMCLIKSVCPNIIGKKAVVVGQSNIVGMPIALLLQKELATVTTCHAHTLNLKEEVKTADVLIAAAGCPHLIKGDYIKAGAIVIDVGTTFVEDKTSKTGKRLYGDIEFHTVAPKASFITPVPGGVGPMTIAMLIDSIVLAWKRSNFSHIKELIDQMETENRNIFISDSIL